jgi:membrane-bound metal-dependent hydrolase YbcI (DUF457 family)
VKGIAHFVTGVAIATFFPEIVYGASQNLAFGPLLGGLAGLLPDTLDFKFVRYFDRLDDEIDPAQITTQEGDPDPQAIAERIAAAIARAGAGQEGDRPVKVHLHTVKLGADLWRQWSVVFDGAHDRVLVRIGPVVTTSQVPFAGSEVASLAVGQASVNAPLRCTYDAEIKIDAFSGPSLAFEKVGDAVHVTFLPWHRSWTHSLFVVLLLGAAGFVLAPAYGVVMALAALAHIVEDQVGFMGCNLFFPITRKRTMGLGLIRSGDALPNFFVVWAGLALVLLNLDRFSAAPLIPVWPYVLAVIILPGLFFLGLAAWRTWQARRARLAVVAPRALAVVEALDETEEIDI